MFDEFPSDRDVKDCCALQGGGLQKPMFSSVRSISKLFELAEELEYPSSYGWTPYADTVLWLPHTEFIGLGCWDWGRLEHTDGSGRTGPDWLAHWGPGGGGLRQHVVFTGGQIRYCFPGSLFMHI